MIILRSGFCFKLFDFRIVREQDSAFITYYLVAVLFAITVIQFTEHGILRLLEV
jgi:hypothetical protein